LNRQVVQALFRDALYQVLDNKVFRILSGVVLSFVLATFLVGAREDALVLLFGWKELYYEDIFSFFGQAYPGIDGAGELLIQTVQRVLVDGLAGTVGIMLSIAATAFFVPRMLEKGAADTLFSKPVSRFALLLSRYMAGLIFVALLATVLVGGMHVGFLLNSGYSDPGFLWTILTLIYLFALLHGVSILVGALTRSTVAAILLTMFFMMSNACVHQGWRMKEHFVDAQMRLEQLDADPEIPEDGNPRRADPDEPSVWLHLAYWSLDTLHYALPKTSDASAIAQKLRRDLSVRYAHVWDSEGGLLIMAKPAGFERRDGGRGLEGEGALWELPDASATIRLSRRDLKGTTQLRTAKALKISLEARPEVSAITEDDGYVANTRTSRLDWVESRPQGERMHRVHIFAGGRQLYTLEIEGTRAWREDEAADQAVQTFVGGFTFNQGENATDPMHSYENRLGWNAPLKYNIFFSIGSSLAFLMAVLALAWWRLARIDF
jgi:ABC-type transport system involved in multi-copper enzyme maturation permease subunit